MKIALGSVASFNYHLKDVDGNTIEKSEQPLEYLHGYNNIIPGLENALLDLQVGDAKSVTVQPEDGYGLLEEDLISNVPKSNFPPDAEIVAGMQFQTMTEEGPLVVTVVEVTDKEVIVDGNHPMAGQTLVFDVEITGVRQATEQELEHGHIHHGGHDH